MAVITVRNSTWSLKKGFVTAWLVHESGVSTRTRRGRRDATYDLLRDRISLQLISHGILLSEVLPHRQPHSSCTLTVQDVGCAYSKKFKSDQQQGNIPGYGTAMVMFRMKAVIATITIANRSQDP